MTKERFTGWHIGGRKVSEEAAQAARRRTRKGSLAVDPQTGRTTAQAGKPRRKSGRWQILDVEPQEATKGRRWTIERHADPPTQARLDKQQLDEHINRFLDSPRGQAMLEEKREQLRKSRKSDRPEDEVAAELSRDLGGEQFGLISVDRDGRQRRVGSASLRAAVDKGERVNMRDIVEQPTSYPDGSRRRD